MEQQIEDLDARVKTAVSTGDVPKDLRVVFGDEALAQALAMRATEQHAGKSVRVYLDGKGCDGFFYGVAFDNPEVHDLAWVQGGLPVIVDRDAFQFICGSQVAWVDDERGRGFLVENPQHRRFRGKFFKKNAWKERLEGAKNLKN